MYGLEVLPFKHTDAFEICSKDFGTRVDYIFYFVSDIYVYRDVNKIL